jgi:hypothetical protein
LENLSNDEELQKALENIKENNKTSATGSIGLHELKQHKQLSNKE